jgi:hypothetical protein
VANELISGPPFGSTRFTGNARHGRELMGCPFDPSQGKGSSLYVNPVNMLNILTKVLAEGKGGTVRNRPEEASGKAMSPDFIGT